MIRKITADEVRHFMEVCDKQFREAGFFINSIKFIRTDDKTTPRILFNYEERETDQYETQEYKTKE